MAEMMLERAVEDAERNKPGGVSGGDTDTSHSVCGGSSSSVSLAVNAAIRRSYRAAATGLPVPKTMTFAPIGVRL